MLRKICFKHPDRCAWVHTVRVRWDMAIPDPAIEFLELLTSFSSLRTLIIFPAGAALIDTPLMTFLDCCTTYSSLRHVEMFNARSTSADISRLYNVPNLTTLVIGDFSIPSDAVFVPSKHFLPTKLTSIEFRHTTALPTGHCVEYLLHNHPLLSTLRWSIKLPRFYCGQFPPDAVFEALSSLTSTLTTFQLLLIDCESTSNDHQLDFSDFVNLRSLEVHERVTLARNYPATRPRHDRGDLSSRLPASLHTLKVCFSSFHTLRCVYNARIIFDPNSQVLRDKESSKDDYSWILELAKNKIHRNTQLSTITLTEDACWSWDVNRMYEGRLMDVPDIVEWNYPQEVEASFRTSSIKLNVMLRAPLS